MRPIIGPLGYIIGIDISAPPFEPVTPVGSQGAGGTTLPSRGIGINTPLLGLHFSGTETAGLHIGLTPAIFLGV